MEERLMRCIFAVPFWAISSVGSERSPHTRKVTGSNPVLPTPPKEPRPQPEAPAPLLPRSRGFFLLRGGRCFFAARPRSSTDRIDVS